MRIEEPGLRIKVDSKTKISLDHANLANHTLRDPFSGLLDEGYKPHPHRFHEKTLLLPGSIHHQVCLLKVHSQGLFAQDMFSRIQAHQGMLTMSRMGRSDINHIHLGIFNQGLVRSMNSSNAMLTRKGLRGPLPSRTHGNQFPSGSMLQALGKFASDTTGSKNTPTDGL